MEGIGAEETLLDGEPKREGTAEKAKGDAYEGRLKVFMRTARRLEEGTGPLRTMEPSPWQREGPFSYSCPFNKLLIALPRQI